MENFEVITGLWPVIAETTGIVMALMWITKQFKLKKKFLPLFALVYGFCVTFLFIGLSWVTVLVGIICGLSAMGVYSGGKTVAGK